MSRQPLILSVPKPCNASWNDMTPDGAGRHCDSCRTTVVDFTAMSDGELLSYFTNNGFGGCGRFRDDQLLRPLHHVLPPLKRRSLAGIAASAILMITLSTSATAQQHRFTGKPAAVQPRTTANPVPENIVPRISGTMTDERGVPVVNAYVELRYNGKIVAREVTDFDGVFQIIGDTALPEDAQCEVIAHFQHTETVRHVTVQKDFPELRMIWVAKERSEVVRTRMGMIAPLIDPKPAGGTKKPPR